jgi:TRAP-type C4-dicarboxylate transport system substrate-binding protein
MKKFLPVFWILACIFLCGPTAISVRAQDPPKIRILIGTVAPRDTLWHEVLKDLKRDWEKIYGRNMKILIYPGGVLGDGPKMVEKVQDGSLQAVGLSSVGLSRIDDAIACLQIPMMIRSYEELDYVRQRIGPKLERRLEQKGFKLLHWADAGWVHTFSEDPVRTPEDLRKMKLFTTAGDEETVKLYQEFGFEVYPKPLSDLIPSLKTGSINAINLIPTYVSLTNAFRDVPNMTEIKWLPLVAGTVIDLDVWNAIPGKYHPELLEAARKAGERYRDAIRNQDEVSIREMVKKGLNIVELDEVTKALWQKDAEKSYPKLRGRYTPPEFFDEVQRLLDEYRKSGEQEGEQKTKTEKSDEQETVPKGAE